MIAGSCWNHGVTHDNLLPNKSFAFEFDQGNYSYFQTKSEATLSVNNCSIRRKYLILNQETYHQMITQGFCVFVVSVRVSLDGVQKLITKKGESVCVLSLSILIKISNSTFILVKSRRWYDTATAWFLLCNRWNSFFWHATLFCTILIDECGRWQRLL